MANPINSLYVHPGTMFVGIGTQRPQEKLTVAGHICPATTLAYDLGTSNLRFRDLYLGGNSINLGGTLLSRDSGTGGLRVLDPASGGAPLDMTVRNLIASNVSVIGDFVTLNTVTSNNEQMVITNAGTGPGLKVTQTGANSIAEFYDDGGVLVMKIADGGNVGIGTGAPTAALHVRPNTASAGVIIDQTGSGIIVDIRGGGVSKVIVDSQGNVGIGTTRPKTQLDVVGCITQGGYGLLTPSGTSFPVNTSDIAWTSLILNGITLSGGNVEINFTHPGVYIANIIINSDSTSAGNFSVFTYYYASNTWMPWQNSETSQTWNGSVESKNMFMLIANSTYSLKWKFNSVNFTGSAFGFSGSSFGSLWSRLMIWKVG